MFLSIKSLEDDLKKSRLKFIETGYLYGIDFSHSIQHVRDTDQLIKLEKLLTYKQLEEIQRDLSMFINFSLILENGDILKVGDSCQFLCQNSLIDIVITEIIVDRFKFFVEGYREEYCDFITIEPVIGSSFRKFNGQGLSSCIDYISSLVVNNEEINCGDIFETHLIEEPVKFMKYNEASDNITCKSTTLKNHYTLEFDSLKLAGIQKIIKKE